MPRAAVPVEKALLVTPQEAAGLLRITQKDLKALIYEGAIKTHPRLTDRITRKSIDEFVTLLENEANKEEGREMDAANQRAWEIPTFGLRENRG